MSTSVDHSIKWTEIWRLFDADEQHDACLCLLESFKDNPDSVITHRVLKRLAEATGTRLPSVQALARKDPDKLATTIRTRAAALLDEQSWRELFTYYYPRKKLGLLCEFLDHVGIPHDENGAATSDNFARPTPEAVATAVASLERTYTTKELARYLAVLARHQLGWEFVAAERDRLFLALQQDTAADSQSATAQADTASASSMDFTVLDRVLIEQVVRAAMQIEGSLDGRQVADLIETTARLSDKWYRAHFHLGFMDVLLPERTLQFDRPGDNQERRGWYLAGVVAGLVRTHDAEGLHNVFEQRAEDLSAVLQKAGGPGASVAKTALRQVLEIGRISDALKIIRGQVAHLGLDFAGEVLDFATVFIRQSNFESAKAIVDELTRQSFVDEDADDLADFRLELARRRGQCLQAAGNFDGAEKEYRDILHAGEERSSPDLLADLGLVKGRFRSFGEVKLPDAREERIALREALTKGEEYFRRAVARPGGSPKAAYPLAMLAYLRWTFSAGKEREERREQAADLASAAVNAIIASEFAAVYRQAGALGQAYFMLAVARMSSLDDVQGREAVVAWQSITSEAGKLPLSDIKVLLEAAEPYGHAIADAIAESVWDNRRDEAAAVLIGGPWMRRSPKLRAALLSISRQPHTPRAERIRLWTTLIPQVIKGNDLSAAEEGLSELETLAETEEDCVALLEFLSDRANYDPVWKETEATWARIHYMRRLGRDEDCATELRRLFYIVRDAQPWEAEQILTAAEDWNLDEQIQRQLRAAMPKVQSDLDTGTEARLAQGEEVRVVFVGGNEVQARYDAAVKEELRKTWPGVHLHIEHTAWSSNWGRELDRLIGLANAADAVVLMYLMRTMLGRGLRAALKKPWIPCTATGKGAILASVRRAAIIGLEKR